MENNNTGSLDLMHDILLPPAISFFPLASGWYLLLALGFAFVVNQGFKYYIAYQCNLYRREALKQLADIHEDKGRLELMKRVGIEHFGREQVASLTGEAWWTFVETHSKVKISSVLKTYAMQVFYQDSNIHNPQYSIEIREMAKVWIETHEGDKP